MSQSQPQQQQLSVFDQIIENKVKLGKYQIKHLLILVLIDCNDGAQLVLMSFIMPILQHEWGISNLVVSILTSVFYLGTATGSCLTGKIADVKGRRLPIIWSSIILFVLSISFFFVPGVISMGIVRYFYGVIYGFSLPLTTSMISEIIPIKFRGKFLVIINMFVSVGKITGCLLAILCLKDFTEGNWRLMMVLSALPSLIVFWGSIYIMKESPRFLIASNRIEEGVEILNEMIRQNHTKGDAVQLNIEYITQEETQQLQTWQQKVFEKSRLSNASPKELLRGDLKIITIKMWICWFIENAMYFGQLVILPFILGKGNKTFGKYIITVMGEIPSIFISLIIVDTKGLGRKNSLTICFILAGIMHLITYYADDQHLSFYAGIARFFMKLCYAMLYPLSAEVYPTLLRTLGFGFCSGIGRLGAAFIPYIIFGLYEWDTYSSFLIFGIISFIAAICSGSLPYDTLGRTLDLQSQKGSICKNRDSDFAGNYKQNIPLVDIKNSTEENNLEV